MVMRCQDGEGDVEKADEWLNFGGYCISGWCLPWSLILGYPSVPGSPGWWGVLPAEAFRHRLLGSHLQGFWFSNVVWDGAWEFAFLTELAASAVRLRTAPEQRGFPVLYHANIWTWCSFFQKLRIAQLSVSQSFPQPCEVGVTTAFNSQGNWDLARV